MSNESQTAGTNSTAEPGSTAAAPPAAAPAPAPATTAPAAAPAAAPASLGAGLADGAASAAAPAPAPATPPADDGKGKPPAPDDDDDKPAGAPEKYADFTMPEGIQADPEVMGEFAAYAKEKNLSQEDAQKFADMGAKIAQKTRDGFVKQIEQVQSKWVDDSRADKEFGGDKLPENLALANKALGAFGSPALVAMLNESGLCNHPEIIRAFYRVSQAVSEDKLVPGGKAPASSDPLAKMYPSMVKS